MNDLASDLPSGSPGKTSLVPTDQSPAHPPSASQAATPNPILNPFDPRVTLTDSQRDPLYLVPPQTWAQLNPSLGVQAQRPRAKATVAAKATRKINAELNKANAARLSADLEKLAVLQRTQIEKIAQDHNRKAPEIKKLITHQTHYRQSRAPSLSNALIHKKGVEMNEGMAHHHLNLILILISLHPGREVGERATLAEIREAKENDPLYRDMTKTECKEVIDGLLAYREGKNSSARVTNKGAARDVYLTMERIEADVRDVLYNKSVVLLIHNAMQLQRLHSRTGVEFFAMATRASVDDMIQPTWLGSQGATIFLADGFGTNAWDLLRHFEQSCCSRKFGWSLFARVKRLILNTWNP
jgi:hypothetical protein